MFYASTNNTEKEWSRSGIKKEMPSQNSDEILDKIHKLNIEGMNYGNVVDYYQTQLACWRRFYKQDDTVAVEESFITDTLRCARIQSLNIFFYVIEKADGSLKIQAGFANPSDDEEILTDL